MGRESRERGGFVKAPLFGASFGYFSARQKSNAHGRCVPPIVSACGRKKRDTKNKAVAIYSATALLSFC